MSTTLAIAGAVSQPKEGETKMQATRSLVESESERREPADPPSYWWRRADEQRLTLALGQSEEEPESLDPRDLLSQDEIALSVAKPPHR